MDLNIVLFYSRMDAEFLADDNFPDGTQVEPQAPIVKRWLVKNVGQEAWDENTKVTITCF